MKLNWLISGEVIFGEGLAHALQALAVESRVSPFVGTEIPAIAKSVLRINYLCNSKTIAIFLDPNCIDHVVVKKGHRACTVTLSRLFKRDKLIRNHSEEAMLMTELLEIARSHRPLMNVIFGDKVEFHEFRQVTDQRRSTDEMLRVVVAA